MALSRRIQDLLAKKDFATIESDWLARLEEDPQDLDFFVDVARSLSGQGQETLAQTLLEMLDDALRGLAAWRGRLQVLERAGHLLFSPAESLHAEVLRSLAGLYGEQPSFEGLLETVGLRKAITDIPKTWEKVERLQSLVAFDLGEIVLLEGKGAGRVAEVNIALQSFRVEIAGLPKISVGFKAAPKLMRRLASEHVLHRKIVEPQALKALADQDPPALLRLVLESYEQPVLASDIKRDLSGVVEESRWTAFWGAARKHPQVVVAGSGRQTYHWAKSSEAALSSVWATFSKADPRKKIDMLRRDGARDATLRGRMEAEIRKLGEAAAASDPALAAEIWFALEKTGQVTPDLPWAPQQLLARTDDPRSVISRIEDRALRERAYGLLREVRTDWPPHLLAALGREDDGRTLELLAGMVAEREPVALDRFIDSAIAQPHKAPAAFAWIVERAAGDAALRERAPLRFFQAILAALGAPEFASFRQRLLVHAESGGTLPRLLPLLAVEQAPQALDAVHRSAGLEAYQRDDLQRALQLRFPDLREEVEQVLYALAESIATKQAELHQIGAKDIPANRKAIEEARALGDLRENFEYKAARQRHEYLTARATTLAGQLQRARALDLAAIDTSEVRIGCTVELTGSAGGQRRLSILGPWESDPDAGVISYESELGKQLLGRKPGEIVTMAGEALTVGEIRPFAPA